MSARSSDKPTAEQRRAADPTASVWVTASAGTGKTRVLADRVLRLLLAGTEPQQVLGLTFTNAAAAEMVARIQRDLGRFATLAEAELTTEMAALLGRPPRADELTRARGLFAKVLDLPAGLSLMTIHGFCQSLLRRFPLEAGVPPHFELIDPRSAADLWHEALETVLMDDRHEIRSALGRLALQLGDQTLGEALIALRDGRLRLAEPLRRGENVEAALQRLHGLLEVPYRTTAEAVKRVACADPAIDGDALGAACRALALGSNKDQERGLGIGDWLAADLDRRLAGYDSYRAIFFTTKGEARKPGSLITKKASDSAPDAGAALLAEQERLSRFTELEKAAANAERGSALLELGAAVLAAYEQRKRRLAVLDYDDLIDATARLLAQDGAAGWVQYKLDQQIDHLLVDEGQDTSPAQWAIVEALADEFFSGEGARPGGRTLFVVGDEKQSIMSFQGADLEIFHGTRRRLTARAREAGLPCREVPLQRSFRSAPTILAAVDAVFGRPEARAGVVADDHPLRHESARADAPGMVELWPLLEAEEVDEPDAWELPDRPQRVDQKERRLAQAIAGRIHRWRRDETRLASIGRPIRPGDVMILLPRRGVMQDLLIRELKQLQIPVAGADRLALTDELAVKDLMALGDSLLLPEDDLTLAATLRSPLFDLGEDDLFELAHGRDGARLHARLGQLDRPSIAAVRQRFAELRRQADFMPPFEFYARLLSEGSGRRQLQSRLGPAALEPIEAFLAQALAYQRGHPPSLQGFLHWLRADSTELIRDPDQPRDEVRVLTVHGAKGLEAPIVFLTDATYGPRFQDRLLWPKSGGPPLWSVRQEDRDRVSEAAWQRARARQLEEHRRLLYVAMTRPRDWLIVTGWKHRNGSRELTWYDLIERGLDELSAEQVEMAISGHLSGPGRRLGNAATVAVRQMDLPLPAPGEAVPPPPSWLREPAAEEVSLARPLSPSLQGDDEEPAAVSPLSVESETRRFTRGRLIHRLLQTLPERPRAARTETLTRFLAQPSLALEEAERAAIAGEVEAILGHPDLAAVFEPGSRAEVPLAGLVGERVVVGQVDRLAVGDDEVLLVDYKTNRSPPESVAQVPVAYLRQMAAYRALIGRIHPGRSVRTALLWTVGPRLMFLDDALLDRHGPAPGRS